MTQTGTTWITGAGTGIGLEVVRGLVERGWRVAVSGRSEASLAALVDELGAERVLAAPVDVTDAHAVGAAFEHICTTWCVPDTVILNAGDYEPMSLDDFDPELFRRIMAVNFQGVVNAMAAALPHMARGGRIVATASLAAYRGLPNAAPYGASKAAVLNMFEALRPQAEARGLELRVINPGFVKTRLTAKNAFTMPALITPEAAAAAILRGLDGHGFEIAFPRRFAWVMKLLRCLPYGVYFRLTRRMAA